MSFGLNIVGNMASLRPTDANAIAVADLNCPIDIHARVAFPPSPAHANVKLAASNDQILLTLRL